jgi:hydrogenase-4 component B
MAKGVESPHCEVWPISSVGEKTIWMDIVGVLPLDVAGSAIVLWLTLGLLGLALQRSPRHITNIIFPLGAIVSLVLAATGFWALGEAASYVILPLGLPDLPLHLRLDPLSAFFLILLGGASFGVSLFGAGYFKSMQGNTLGLLCLEYHLFLAGMALVLLADDAYMFMVAWETMALSSYFLVTTDHAIPDIRKAGYLYLLIAHVGAIAILLSFGMMQGGHGIGAYTFAAMRVICQRSGHRWCFCWRCSALARKQACCRCTSGYPKPTRLRLRRFPH